MHTKVLFAMRYLLAFPDPTKGWIPFAMQELEEIKKSMSVDAIVTTSPPVSAHLIGRKAKADVRMLRGWPIFAIYGRRIWRRATIWSGCWNGRWSERRCAMRMRW